MAGFEGRGEDYDFNRDAVHLCRMDDCLAQSKKRFLCAHCKKDLHISRFEQIGSPLTQPLEFDHVTYRRTVCIGCRKASLKAAAEHPLHSRDVARFMSGLASQMRAGARSRGLPCLIDKEDLVDMYLRQGAACAVSGIPFKLDGAAGFRDKRGWFKPSVDRIDSRGGYSVANVHLVAQAVNLMNFDLPMGLFLDLCERITERRFSGDL